MGKREALKPGWLPGASKAGRLRLCPGQLRGKVGLRPGGCGESEPSACRWRGLGDPREPQGPIWRVSAPRGMWAPRGQDVFLRVARNLHFNVGSGFFFFFLSLVIDSNF